MFFAPSAVEGPAVAFRHSSTNFRLRTLIACFRKPCFVPGHDLYRAEGRPALYHGTTSKPALSVVEECRKGPEMRRALAHDGFKPVHAERFSKNTLPPSKRNRSPASVVLQGIAASCRCKAPILPIPAGLPTAHRCAASQRCNRWPSRIGAHRIGGQRYPAFIPRPVALGISPIPPGIGKPVGNHASSATGSEL